MLNWQKPNNMTQTSYVFRAQKTVNTINVNQNVFKFFDFCISIAVTHQYFDSAEDAVGVECQSLASLNVHHQHILSVLLNPTHWI